MRLRTLFASLALAGASAGLALAEERPMSFKDWWPNYLDLGPLRAPPTAQNPYGEDFDYAAEFAKLDLAAVKRDLEALMRDSQSWWPADFGHYGPLFIRLAWHSAGTYRIFDGRGGADGGQIRFEPQNSWPDNANLDRARRLLWPIKKKYGRSLSWADLIILSGNVALESMGFKTFGFAGGRPDHWMADLTYWGPERKWLEDLRHGAGRSLKKPLAATQMGLIYVNPEGPNGVPDPLAAARDIRESFGRMGMNDEETVALIAGGHTFGKAHGAHKPDDCVGPAPTGAALEHQGLGWVNRCGSGKGADTVTSGLEGAWTANPIAFTTNFLDNLMTFEWVQTRSPAGAIQWIPANGAAANLVPDAHDPGRRHPPIMLTTDLALKEDPAYRAIVERFRANPELFKDAFARAWFKLTHRDMGPHWRYLGAEVPREMLLWQDPVPQASASSGLDARDLEALKARIREAGLEPADLVRVAWGSAVTYRNSDKRGGTNGARIRLAPQKDWEVNDPPALARVIAALEKIQADFNGRARGGKRVSLADLIVLAGNTAIEDAAARAGLRIEVPFTPGRADAAAEHTDAESFAVLEPLADPFRNYYSSRHWLPPLEAMVDRAHLLALGVPELVALVGGMRTLGANAGGSRHGLFANRTGVLDNSWFVNLLDMGTEWRPSAKDPGLYEGYDRKTGELRWTATPVDLVFGAHSELRAVAEAYGADDGKEEFVRDFVAAWAKVMNHGLPPRRAGYGPVRTASSAPPRG
ncbi:MAG: catalase/peroxidase HPI [Xanthomonadales bacterium]|nr:catalase/peroxidase HPI [Xanthomonadales bacterium]